MKVVMTRTTDVFVGLNRRAEIARNANANVFVSVHLNAHTGSANGVETFLHTRSSASLELARNVNNKMRSQLGRLAGRIITNRGVKKANFAVLRGTYQHMLAVLPEVLFMDNQQDNQVIKHRDFVTTAAKAIADGIRQTVSEDSLVCIDPGHGGRDPGASGYGLLEKDLNLSIGLALRDELEGNTSAGTYTVKRGDTLWGIANAHDITVTQLKNLNNLKSDLIHPGDVLKLTGTAPKKKTVHLPAAAKTWRTYKLNVQPVKANSDWSLTPARYGGLTYDILDEPYTDVVTIQTGRGRRNIYVGSGTGAVIK